LKQPCKVCGELTNNKIYCSILCYGLFKKSELKRTTCPICRKKTENPKFCSIKCRDKFAQKFGKKRTKRTKLCPSCQKHFSTYYPNQIWCSKTCYRRKFKINEHYFDEITSDNAYILGVIFSVGQMLNACENKILFRHKDKIIIEMISSALSSEYPIKRKNPHWEIRPSSKHLVDRLVDLGFRRESKFFSFPEIPHSCKALFIQGMMDTTVVKTKKNKLYKLVRSKELFLNMREFGWRGYYSLSGIWTW
jgi:hypothetical protein